MSTYQPPYPLYDTRSFVPRDQIHLVPEETLDASMREELTSLRRGVEINYVLNDEPRNRKIIEERTTYFQMVAYKEGWRFDPEKYKVRFVQPRHPVFGNGRKKQVYAFDKTNADTPFGQTSAEGNIGFEFYGPSDAQHRMEPQEADGLAAKVRRLFGER